jgi:hypothetical protein
VKPTNKLGHAGAHVETGQRFGGTAVDQLGSIALAC